MKRDIPQFLLQMEERKIPAEKDGFSLPFLDRTLKRIAGFIDSFYIHDLTSSSKGYLQRLDARVKIIFLISYILLITISASIGVLSAIAVFLMLLYIFSGLNVSHVYLKVFLFSFIFGFLIALPAALNLITPGKTVLVILRLQKPEQYWIYHIPAEITITREGLLVVFRLYLKVMNSVALSLLVYYTTPFHRIIKALRVIKVPDLFLMVITMAHKFIFVLAHSVQETYFALKLRWWKRIRHSEADQIIAGRIVYLFRLSWHKYEEIYMAMIARGFQGEANFCYLEKVSSRDILSLSFFLLFGIVLYILL